MRHKDVKILDISKPNGVVIENLGVFDKPIKDKENYLFCKNFVNNLKVFID